MKAPDKIYLHGYEFDKTPCDRWDAEPTPKKMFGYKAKFVEYIRKEALLEWAKETYLTENASAIRKVCFKQLVEKLMSM